LGGMLQPDQYKPGKELPAAAAPASAASNRFR